MKKILIAVTAIVFLFSCKKEMCPEDLLQAGNVNKSGINKSMVTRPMYVDFYATPNMSLPPVQCVPVEFNVILGGGTIVYGTATHLGKIDSQNSWGRLQSCMLGPVPGQVTTNNKGQIAAANGDLLYFESTDVTSMMNGVMTGIVTLTGGTGRFLDATGSINISGIVNFQTGVVTWTGTGTITF